MIYIKVISIVRSTCWAVQKRSARGFCLKNSALGAKSSQGDYDVLSTSQYSEKSTCGGDPGQGYTINLQYDGLNTGGERWERGLHKCTFGGLPLL